MFHVVKNDPRQGLPKGGSFVHVQDVRFVDICLANCLHTPVPDMLLRSLLSTVCPALAGRRIAASAWVASTIEERSRYNSSFGP